MQGRAYIRKPRRRRHRCPRCRRPAFYVAKGGEARARKDHPLCRDCMDEAAAEGRRRARELPPATWATGGE